MNKGKVKLTVTIERRLLNEAKKVARKKHLSLSGVIENFLEFFINPSVYCFKCTQKFFSKDAEICPKCGWMICPYCKSCGCELSEETLRAIFYMRRVYEDLLIGRVK